LAVGGFQDSTMAEIFHPEARSRRPAAVMDMAVAAMDLVELGESVY
jgi:hypothetical protein